jgi:hypothetical protein
MGTLRRKQGEHYSWECLIWLPPQHQIRASERQKRTALQVM